MVLAFREVNQNYAAMPHKFTEINAAIVLK
jgi:hypothetical protein